LVSAAIIMVILMPQDQNNNTTTIEITKEARDTLSTYCKVFNHSQKQLATDILLEYFGNWKNNLKNFKRQTCIRKKQPPS